MWYYSQMYITTTYCTLNSKTVYNTEGNKREILSKKLHLCIKESKQIEWW